MTDRSVTKHENLCEHCCTVMVNGRCPDPNCAKHWESGEKALTSNQNTCPHGISRTANPGCEHCALRDAEHALAMIAAVTPEDTDVGRYARNYFRRQSKTPQLPVETKPPPDPFEATAILADPNTMRIDIRFQNRADYEAAVAFFGMGDSSEETESSAPRGEAGDRAGPQVSPQSSGKASDECPKGGEHYWHTDGYCVKCEQSENGKGDV